MDNPFEILDKAYRNAKSQLNPLELSDIQRNWIHIIIKNAESQKGVLTVLITSLVKKIETPSQDVRYHKKELVNGYSGRGFDTKYITPFINKKFQRYAMKGGSGWLTRSLEQAHPYTLEYPGRIQNLPVKDAFLGILNDIEENKANPEKYLIAVLAGLIKVMERSHIRASLFESENNKDYKVQQAERITIDKILQILIRHFSLGYGVSGASRLPVLAVYSVYEMLMEIERYKGKSLLPLKSHTTSDTKSGGIGDIEVLDENGDFFEAVEIKHEIPITTTLVQDAYQKFESTPVHRYYLLTTAEPNIENSTSVDSLMQECHAKHSCEIIVNGIVPSLRYYLRLVSNPKLFIDNYSYNLQQDFSQNTDIKEIHLRYWEELLKYL